MYQALPSGPTVISSGLSVHPPQGPCSGPAANGGVYAGVAAWAGAANAIAPMPAHDTALASTHATARIALRGLMFLDTIPQPPDVCTVCRRDPPLEDRDLRLVADEEPVRPRLAVVAADVDVASEQR